MWATLAVLTVLFGVSAYLTRMREQYAQKKQAAEAGVDARVATAWDEFGLVEDPDVARTRVDALLDDVDPRALREKSAVIALAVMATRVGRTDALSDLAARAEQLDGGCGETAALGVLAAAYAGDEVRAKELLARSQAVMSGCASCGASADSKILMAEVQIALDALMSGALGETAGA